VISKHNIKPFLAVPLLVIFAFSATPKLFLHNLIANHKDGSSSGGSKMQQFSVASFHCDCENLVVQVPYLDNPVHSQGPFSKIFQRFQIKKEKPAYPIHYFIFGFRGPPTMS
jgi:hypothetical protein